MLTDNAAEFKKCSTCFFPRSIVQLLFAYVSIVFPFLLIVYFHSSIFFSLNEKFAQKNSLFFSGVLEPFLFYIFVVGTYLYVGYVTKFENNRSTKFSKIVAPHSKYEALGSINRRHRLYGRGQGPYCNRGSPTPVVFSFVLVWFLFCFCLFQVFVFVF